jgi:hypothetical protein
MQKEIWKDIPGYEGFYKASNLGRIKSVERYIKNSKGSGFRIVRERILKHKIDRFGYNHVSLHKKGKQKTYLVHRLVFKAFNNNLPSGNKIVIDHINNNPYDNRLLNLQMITQRENASKDKIGKYSSDYTGVTLRKNNWEAKISINGKTLSLGRFDNELEAYKAYQNKLKQLI